MVGIQVGNKQEERKGEEKRMIRENKKTSLSRAMREKTSAGEDFCGSDIDDMTYDISGSGFDDATSDMQLQLGGERERDDTCESFENPSKTRCSYHKSQRKPSLKSSCPF